MKKHPERFEKLLQNASVLFQASGQTHNAAVAHHKVGDMQEMLGEIDLALSSYRAAVSLFEACAASSAESADSSSEAVYKIVSLVALAEVSLGLAYRKNNQLSEAIGLYKHAITLLRGKDAKVVRSNLKVALKLQACPTGLVKETTTSDNQQYGPDKGWKLKDHIKVPETACAMCLEKGSLSPGGTLKHCAGCGDEMYCSKSCQKQHWKAGHKKAAAKHRRSDTSRWPVPVTKARKLYRQSLSQRASVQPKSRR